MKMLLHIQSKHCPESYIHGFFDLFLYYDIVSICVPSKDYICIIIIYIIHVIPNALCCLLVAL